MPPDPISLADRFAIIDLLSGYCHAMDASRADLAIALFADDALLETPVGRAEGRDEILAWIEGRLAMRDPRYQVGHHLLHPLLARTGDDVVRVRSMLVYTRMADDSEMAADLLSTGIYEDVVRRSADGWRFARRAYALRAPLDDAYFSAIGRGDGGPPVPA